MSTHEPHPPAEQRAAVVTGASSGIGAATARQLAALGHPVVLAARRVDRCEDLAAGIAAGGGRAEVRPLDLADPAAIDEFVDGLDTLVGPVEVLVSCAGDVLPSTTVGTDPADFARQVQINLLGAQRLVADLIPPMIERRRGDVVFVTSDVVRAPRPSMASYVASKWGLEGLARVMQMELEGTGVRASIVRPGPTMTGMGSEWDMDMIVPILDEWKRWGLVRHDGYLDADGVAAAVVAVVGAPRGTHLTLVEVEPEAPVSRRA